MRFAGAGVTKRFQKRDQTESQLDVTALEGMALLLSRSRADSSSVQR